jgi:ATP-dependent Clp protease ATP-binding subunit ClpC
MWQRFTSTAKKSVFLAQEEAGTLHDREVSTGHLLLGMMRLKDSRACQALEHMGIEPAEVADGVRKVLQPRSDLSDADFRLSNCAKHSIDLAWDEARNMGNEFIGTEHLLLGIIREPIGAGRVLINLGTDIERGRATVLDLQAQSGGGPEDDGCYHPDDSS